MCPDGTSKKRRAPDDGEITDRLGATVAGAGAGEMHSATQKRPETGATAGPQIEECMR